jgi:hypothetical protein
MTTETCAYVAGFLAARAATAATLRGRDARLTTAVFDAMGSAFLLVRIACLVPFLSSAASDPSSYADDATRVPAFDSHMRLETAWYLAAGICMLADAGAALSVSMLLHHVLAVALVQLSLAHNLTRLGMALLPYLAASNPLLHVAKALRAANCDRASRIAFAAFAVVFAAGRMVAFPIAYVPAVVANGAIHWLPERAALYYATISLCGALCVLQAFWFRRIVAVLLLTKTARPPA